MSDYNNSGVLFRNDKKTSEKSPEYTGKITIEGVEKRLAAWVKEKNGKKFFSLKISDFQNQQSDPESTQGPTEQEPLPF